MALGPKESAGIQANQKSSQEIDEQSRVRREKLEQLRNAKRAYPHGIRISHNSAEIFSKYSEVSDAAVLAEAGSLSLAGRVNFIRAFGKAGFVKIRDRKGTLQIYVAKDKVSAEDFAAYQVLELGDVVRVSGKLLRTKTGELRLEAATFQ